jgi:hypothetical protein
MDIESEAHSVASTFGFVGDIVLDWILTPVESGVLALPRRMTRDSWYLALNQVTSYRAK